MENKGLLLIPDLSGFSNFVTTRELKCSQHVIKELLEVLIDSNQLGLEISEIEGDAVLFFKFGPLPELKDIFDQVKKMFFNFHQYLQMYEKMRTCDCNACVSVINLSLKVITHYGEFAKYQVKNFDKLIGKDVVVAHQLLKNDIDLHEYWLMTKSMLPNIQSNEFDETIIWHQGLKQTEQGEMQFIYTFLTPYKK